MVGNAVPVKLAEAVAQKIRKDLSKKVEEKLVAVH